MLLPKNQKEAFLHYLSNMDISMVNTILDDNLTYMKVSKETFTNKLEEKIETFKEYTDTELKIKTEDETNKKLKVYYLDTDNPAKAKNFGVSKSTFDNLLFLKAGVVVKEIPAKK